MQRICLRIASVKGYLQAIKKSEKGQPESLSCSRVPWLPIAVVLPLFQDTEKCHSFTLGPFLPSYTLWAALYNSANTPNRYLHEKRMKCATKLKRFLWKEKLLTAKPSFKCLKVLPNAMASFLKAVCNPFFQQPQKHTQQATQAHSRLAGKALLL